MPILPGYSTGSMATTTVVVRMAASSSHPSANLRHAAEPPCKWTETHVKFPRKVNRNQRVEIPQSIIQDHPPLSGQPRPASTTRPFWRRCICLRLHGPHFPLSPHAAIEAHLALRSLTPPPGQSRGSLLVRRFSVNFTHPRKIC